MNQRVARPVAHADDAELLQHRRDPLVKDLFLRGKCPRRSSAAGAQSRSSAATAV